MARDLVSARLRLPQVRVLGSSRTRPSGLAVRVASAVQRPACPQYEAPSRRTPDRRDSKMRDFEVSGRPVALIWERRRWCASRAAVGSARTTRCSWAASPCGWRTVWATDAKATTINTTAKRHGPSWRLVNSLLVA